MEIPHLEIEKERSKVPAERQEVEPHFLQSRFVRLQALHDDHLLELTVANAFRPNIFR